MDERLRLLEELLGVIVTIREEQVSARMGLGRNEREKRERATIYAAEIQHQAERIDDLLERIAESKEAVEKPT